MAGHQHRRAEQWIAAIECLHDNTAGIEFVILLNLTLCQQAGARHRSMKVIRMGGAERRQLSTRLCPGGGGGTVRMDDAPNILESAIKLEVRRGVQAGPEPPFKYSGPNRERPLLYPGA